MHDKLAIAMIGLKGIPARYGGIETHAEQIAVRLAAKGHDVRVYCRNRFRPDDAERRRIDGYEHSSAGSFYRGVRLAYRPSINTKHFDAASHTLLCATESAFRTSFDVVHFHGIGPSAFVSIPRLAGRTVVTTIHALDWRQKKWGTWAKKRLLQGESTAVRRSDGVIAVSQTLVRYIAERYGVDARYVPNGTTIVEPIAARSIHEYGLRGDDYILTVGRIIPDRGLHHLIDAFQRVDPPLKLVIVGRESPRTAYSEMLESMSDDRVVFTGEVYGDRLGELYSNCRFYALASEVEGLPITVCEAMGFGKAVLLSDIPENREVGGDVAEFFKTNDVNSLSEALERMLEDGFDLAGRGRRGIERVASEYNWDRVADGVEAFYAEVLARKMGRAA